MTESISQQTLSLVASTFLFQGIDDIIVERMIRDRRCQQTRFPKNAIVFDETHFLRCLGIVLSGEIRVDKQTTEGKFMKMSHLKPGECFGAAAMFGHRERYATVLTATKPTQVLFLPEDLIRWAMRRDFTITENYIQYLSDRIWFLNEKISGLTAGSAAKQLSVFLLEHCGDQGNITVSMTELSAQLHLGRSSLYRAVDALADQGLIQKENKSIIILDKPALQRLASGE
jgi:CRP-like cAMP-binding protein